MLKREYFAATVTEIGGHGVQNTQIENKFMQTLKLEWLVVKCKLKMLYTLCPKTSTFRDARRRQKK
jgi:hypothetical protein